MIFESFLKKKYVDIKKFIKGKRNNIFTYELNEKTVVKI